MLKILGIILILAAGAGMGFEKSSGLTQREKDLGMMIHMAVLLKGQIRWGNASLCEAFCETGRKLPGIWGEFLKETAKRMNETANDRFGELFRQCAAEKLGRRNLSESEWEIFCSLGEHLGYLDRETQLRQLELYEEELVRFRENLREEMPAKKKIYQSLGVFGAVLLAILVW